jgi:RNA polymerase sigma-70 factor (ECF subfamily)
LLILLVLSDDENEAIAKIYEKHHKRMLYQARKILGADRAEEIVQDVFINLMGKLGKEKISDLCDKPGLFFVIVVKNYSINVLKQETKKIKAAQFDENNENADIFTTTALNPEDAAMDHEDRDRLVCLIRQLKPAVRQLLEYKYIIGYSNKEIADILEISQTLVSTRIERAKKKLKAIIEDDEVTDRANE